METITERISELRQLLTDDLLRPEFRREDMPETYGHCYVASEAFYHLWGKELGLHPYRARDASGVVHWWLGDGDGRIVDPTETQYVLRGLEPPYEDGKRGGFLTREPSNRARVLMNRVLVVEANNI